LRFVGVLAVTFHKHYLLTKIRLSFKIYTSHFQTALCATIAKLYCQMLKAVESNKTVTTISLDEPSNQHLPSKEKKASHRID